MIHLCSDDGANPCKALVLYTPNPLSRPTITVEEPDDAPEHSTLIAQPNRQRDSAARLMSFFTIHRTALFAQTIWLLSIRPQS